MNSGQSVLYRDAILGNVLTFKKIMQKGKPIILV